MALIRDAEIRVARAEHGGAGLPRHVAVIMDGNGRWAAQRGLPRQEGHRQGVEAVRRCVQAAGELGISYLTLYAFSSENWRRPPMEITVLMGLLKHYVRSDLDALAKANVRIRIIGSREGLSADILGLIDECEARTRDNIGLNLIALSIAADGRKSYVPPSTWHNVYWRASWRPRRSTNGSSLQPSTRAAFPIRIW